MTTEESKLAPKENQISDIASLSASAVAASVSLFVAAGTYTPVSLVVTVTLVIIIAGSFGERARTPMQSAAIAAAIALSSLPGFGFIDEAVRAYSPIKYITEIQPDNYQSHIGNLDLPVAWLAVFIIVMVGDCLNQARWR